MLDKIYVKFNRLAVFGLLQCLIVSFMILKFKKIQLLQTSGRLKTHELTVTALSNFLN